MYPTFEARLDPELVDGLWDCLPDGLLFTDLLAFAIVYFVRVVKLSARAAPTERTGGVRVRAMVPLGVRLELDAWLRSVGGRADEFANDAVAGFLRSSSATALADRTAWSLIYAARDERLLAVARRLSSRWLEPSTDGWLLAAYMDLESSKSRPTRASQDAWRIFGPAGVRLVEREVASRGLDLLHASMTRGLHHGRAGALER